MVSTRNLAVLISLSSISLSLLLCRPVLCQCTKLPIIFNFGDSNSDTGGLVAGLGFPIYPPNGRTFFGHSTGRLSDGRLVIDFLCESVNGSLLSPYLESMGSTFKNGANFAVVGSATLPKYVPFSLNIQLMQFLRFKSRSLQLLTAEHFLSHLNISHNTSFSKYLTRFYHIKKEGSAVECFPFKEYRFLLPGISLYLPHFDQHSHHLENEMNQFWVPLSLLGFFLLAFSQRFPRKLHPKPICWTIGIHSRGSYSLHLRVRMPANEKPIIGSRDSIIVNLHSKTILIELPNFESSQIFAQTGGTLYAPCSFLVTLMIAFEG